MLISTEEEYNTLKNRTEYSFVCCTCGVLWSVKKRNENRSKQLLFLCSNCLSKHTNQVKFGKDYAAQSDVVKEKIRKSNLEKFGTEYASQNENVKQKMRETFVEHYGVNNPMKCKEVQEKTKSTNQKRYGVKSVLSCPEVREKIKKTVLKTYNVDNVSKSKEVQEKIVNTNQQRYGVAYPLLNEGVILKSRNTCREKYGVDYPAQNVDILKKQQQTNIEKYGNKTFLGTEHFKSLCFDLYGTEVPKPGKYKCDSLKFDSSWELAFYLYNRDLGLNIKREPCKLLYVFKGVNHYYYPDFEIDGQLYEIKGDQFFKKDGTMCNPYDHSRDDIAEAKHQCGLRNNVIFLRNAEMKPIIESVSRKHRISDYLICN